MKKICTLFLLLLFSSLVYSQWKKESGGNKFDGKYKAAYVIGKGSEWPYTKPQLVINRFNDKEPNIYLAGIGYTGCESPTISFAFDGIDEILAFESFSNSDNDAAFIYNSKYVLYELDKLLELLKTKNKVYVRYNSRCGKTDLQFGLHGSTAAINYVVGDYFENQKDKLEEIAKQRKEIEAQKKVKREKEIAERKRKDSVATAEKVEKAQQKRIVREKEIESFKRLVSISFGENKVPQSELFKFSPTKTAKAFYCRKIYAKTGAIFEEKEDYFYKSKKYSLYNTIRNNCLMLKAFDSNGKLEYTYYLDKNNLIKLGDSPEILFLVENWDELVKE